MYEKQPTNLIWFAFNITVTTPTLISLVQTSMTDIWRSPGRTATTATVIVRVTVFRSVVRSPGTLASQSRRCGAWRACWWARACSIQTRRQARAMRRFTTVIEILTTNLNSQNHPGMFTYCTFHCFSFWSVWKSIAIVVRSSLKHRSPWSRETVYYNQYMKMSVMYTCFVVINMQFLGIFYILE